MPDPSSQRIKHAQPTHSEPLRPGEQSSPPAFQLPCRTAKLSNWGRQVTWPTSALTSYLPTPAH
eukprot:4272583-Prymnesium_polylepis.1